MEYAKSMSKSEFVEYITGDQLAGLPSISSRAMFGGFGIYREGTIVGIVISEELYLKVDATNQVEYEAMGSIPFEQIAQREQHRLHQVGHEPQCVRTRLARPV